MTTNVVPLWYVPEWTFGERLRKIRRESGLGQVEFANRPAMMNPTRKAPMIPLDFGQRELMLGLFLIVCLVIAGLIVVGAVFLFLKISRSSGRSLR